MGDNHLPPQTGEDNAFPEQESVSVLHPPGISVKNKRKPDLLLVNSSIIVRR
jgi:hypothetical protein